MLVTPPAAGGYARWEVRTHGQVIDPTTVGVVPGRRIRIQASAGEPAAETLRFRQPVLSR